MNFGTQMPEFRLSWKTDFEILIHVNRSLGVSCSHKKGVILVKTAAFCEGKCLERELAINCQQPTLWSLKNKDHSLEGWSDWHVMTSFLVSLRFGLFSITSLSFPESVHLVWFWLNLNFALDFSTAAIIIWALPPLLINVMNLKGTIFVKSIGEASFPVQHQPKICPALTKKGKCRGKPLLKRNMMTLKYLFINLLAI